jgi:hypothetical protein
MKTAGQSQIDAQRDRAIRNCFRKRRSLSVVRRLSRTVPEPHLVYASVPVRRQAVPNAVDEEDSDARERQKTFSRHLFDELWWYHRQRREWPAFRMNEHRSQGDQCFPCAAFGDGAGRPLNVPALRDRGNRESLCWIRFPTQARQFGR